MNSENAGQTFTQVVLEVFKVSGMLNTEGDKLTEEFGLSSARWKVLGAIALSETPVTVPQIGRIMGQSRQATQRLVDAMVKSGMLELVDNPNHKRAKFVNLTEMGSETYAKLDQKQVPWAEAGATNMTKKDLETTLKTLQKIAQYIDR